MVTILFFQRMLLSLEEVLRPISVDKTGGETVANYLDWQFRLLREDLVGPLRRDVTRLLQGDGKTDSLLHLGRGRVVHTLYEEIVRLKIKLENQLDLEASNRLVPGTLVLLTDERRQDFIFGVVTVSASDIPSTLTLECSEVVEDIMLKEEYILFEYTVYYEAYINSLRNLQKYRNIPFSDLVIGAKKTIERSSLFKQMKINVSPEDSFVKVQPVADVATIYKLLMTPRPKREDDSESLLDLDKDEEWRTLQEFDSSQRLAIQKSLKMEMSLIQGPPGTGKSYVGSEIVKMLMNNLHSFSNKHNLPILVICYTNSALDQFLQLLLRFTQRIVRIGSRSKSPMLEAHTLSSLRSYLSEKMLRKQSLYEQEKQLLIKINSLKTAIGTSTTASADRALLRELTQELSQLKCVEDSRLCRKADIVGLTVTGAAKHRDMLEIFKPSIVMVEEAAEILESHLVAALPSSCRHLVMIGDHLQLRPSTANFELVRSHGFGVSLFERMVEADLPHVRLSTQHRMAPAIAELVSPVYPDLINHDSVRGRPPLPGINRNLLFLSHNEAEDAGEGRSKSNLYEARMVVGIARLLVTLGVKAEDIVILAAYVGQLRTVRRLVEENRLEVGSDTIDNYQGEEREVVLVSLVRSGSGSIGFLAQENRATVGLTRARRGLVILGSLELLCQQSQVWRRVSQILRQGDSLVESIQLTCAAHGSTTQIRTPEDFSLSPLGGCSAPCEERLRCGHHCSLHCHPASRRHQCGQPCEKLCANNLHRCPLPCDSLCGLRCEESRELELECGHTTTVPCYVRNHTVSCPELLTVSLPCGHSTALPCSQREDPLPPCPLPCQHQLECGHPCSLPCHGTQQPHQSQCREPCSRRRRGCRADHRCERLCYEDCGPPCDLTVSRSLPCHHQANMECHTDPAQYECTKVRGSGAQSDQLLILPSFRDVVWCWSVVTPAGLCVTSSVDPARSGWSLWFCPAATRLVGGSVGILLPPVLTSSLLVSPRCVLTRPESSVEPPVVWSPLPVPSPVVPGCPVLISVLEPALTAPVTASTSPARLTVRELWSAATPALLSVAPSVLPAPGGVR